MKIDFKTLLICIIVPLILGSIVGLLTSPYSEYSNLILPSFSLSPIIFRIVWPILYILMGVSSYLIIKENSNLKRQALIIYGVQLLVNLFWSVLFFYLSFRLLAFILLLLLIVLVIIMIIIFYKISKTSAYLQIPYLIWIIYAGILNLSIYLLNM